MTDNNASLHIFRRPEEVPVMPEAKVDFLTKLLYPDGRKGIGAPVLGATGGVVLSMMRHYQQGIPPFAKVYWHIGGFALGYWVGGLIEKWKGTVNAERDAMMSHYISLHPEDFIEDPAPKLKYVLYPWVPSREQWDPLKKYPLR